MRNAGHASRSSFRDVSGYLAVIGKFVDGDIDARTFETEYLHLAKSEQRLLDDDIYAVIQDLFGDADAYVDDPELRTDPEDLDADQLLASARRAQERLRRIQAM